MDNKYCNACKSELPRESFGKNKTKPDGLQNQCKSCRSEAQKKSDAYKKYQQEYSKQNKEKLSKLAKQKYQENPEPAKQRARQWKKKNPDKKKELDRRWRDNNKERKLANSYRWIRENPDKRKATIAKYNASHREQARIKAAQRRAIMQANQHVKYSKEQLLGKLLIWKYKCYLCGNILDDKFHWDHVKPIIKGGPDMISNLRPTHSKCNQSKGGKWPLER